MSSSYNDGLTSVAIGTTEFESVIATEGFATDDVVVDELNCVEAGACKTSCRHGVDESAAVTVGIC